MEFGEFKVKEGVFIPDIGIDYPTDDPFQRLLHVDLEDSSKGKFQFDETYPYLDTSLLFKISSIFGYLIKWTLTTIHNRCHFGLQIEGKENVRKYKRQLRDGAVCICNHVYKFDALGVHSAWQRFKQVRIPMFAKHFNGRSSWILRQVGGIPIPETREGIRKFNEAFDEFARRKYWFIVFPEAVRWDMYVPVRPFRRRAFSMAYKYDRPIVPNVFSFRERKGIYRLFGKKDYPCVTLHVGEPIWFDKSANRKAELDRVCREAHEAMERMAGIEINPWPAMEE
jgi:1-acyl-sn-glycerol-3-phosphate acyltransferase